MDPVREALRVFVELKEKTIEGLRDKDKRERVGQKLRSRAREIPEMILELGLVPTISYCLAKAGVDNIVKVTKVIKKLDPKSLKELSEIEEEKLAYALYTYVLLNYLSIIACKVEEIEFRVEELAEKDSVEISDILIKYIEALMRYNIKTLIHKLLQPYLLQFKRLCEAVYKPERQ